MEWQTWRILKHVDILITNLWQNSFVLAFPKRASNANKFVITTSVLASISMWVAEVWKFWHGNEFCWTPALLGLSTSLLCCWILSILREQCPLCSSTFNCAQYDLCYLNSIIFSYTNPKRCELASMYVNHATLMFEGAESITSSSSS